MKLHLIILICLFFIKVSVFSQSLSLSGIVNDAKNQPLLFATVALSNMQDSLITGGITGDNGYFSLAGIEKGRYRVHISYVGLQDYSQEIDLYNSLNLPDIQLEEGVILEEATVIGKRKLLSASKGKITLNVAGSKLTTLPSSTDILSFVPGVIIVNDNIEVIGKGKPLIFINGQEVRSEIQLTSLDPKNIKSITVDRNPSAMYEASYKSIIHITTKNNADKGLSVQLGHGFAVNSKYSHSEKVNINYVNNKVQNFLSLKTNNRRNTQEASSYQRVSSSNVDEEYLYDAKMDNKEDIYTLIYGSNIKLNNSNVLDIQYSLKYGDQNPDISGIEELSGSENDKYDVYRRGNEKDINHTVNLSYSLHKDSVSSLKIFTDFTYKKADSEEYVINTSSISEDENNYNLFSDSKFNVYAGRLEYQTKLFKKLDLSVGTRLSEIRSNSSSLIVSSSEEKIYDTKLIENTQAIYGSLGYQYNSIALEFGLRAERTKSKYYSNNTLIFDRPRILTNVFPSLLIDYEVSPKINLCLSYTSKIKRPSFNQLDPTVGYLSSALYEQGNSSLKPAINHSVELMSTIKDKLNMSVGFSVIENAIVYQVEEDAENDILINSPINLDTNISTLDFNISYPLSFGKFNSNLTGNISIPFVDYSYLGTTKENNFTHYQFVAANTYSITPFSLLFGNFIASSKHSYANTITNPSYMLVLGANFVLLKGRMILTVFGNDLLNKSTPDFSSEYEQVFSSQSSNIDTRMVGAKIIFNVNKFKTLFSKSDSNKLDLERIQ